MSSMPRYVLSQCTPSWRDHSWEITRTNNDGETTAMRCVYCDQTITGFRQCHKRKMRDGLHNAPADLPAVAGKVRRDVGLHSERKGQ